jgi:2-keto-4-pentenoate hydratase/2-oxohepta-3-ene-1,7-dioic acid hydratase in catechol pathway
MRLVTFQLLGRAPRAGAFIDGDARIVDLAEAHTAAFGEAALANVLDIIEGGDAALDRAQETVKKAPASTIRARSDVKLHAPVQRPPQMRDCLCFELHLQQAIAAMMAMTQPNPEAALAEIKQSGLPAAPPIFYQQPIYYKANRFAVIGTEEDVIWPSYCERLDFELEFGVYLKGKVKDAKKENALAHIFGYTIFNDMSARDAQAVEMEGRLGPAKGKDFDTANVMGPCLVTADEIPDPYHLTMIARVNGEEWGRGNSGSMYWKFEDLIAYISRSETLYPGEFLGSGTVGNGCGLEHMRFIKPGDVIELEVEGIGVLRNRVVQPQTNVAT